MSPSGFQLFYITMILVSVTGARPGFAEQKDDDSPGLEMLEFLADWETADGQWIDPAILQQEELKEPTVDEYDES
ncbi:MAG TPA: hypothetical protein ENI64_13325 [Gammaproteobacteria bacterium]|nr:hypothetical protein [Gammaproteobacteria bacterium]